jgi:hypothetical protein
MRRSAGKRIAAFPEPGGSGRCPRYVADVMPPTRTTRGAGLVAVLALVLAGCGGGSKAGSSSTGPTTPAPGSTRLAQYLLQEGEGGFDVFSTPIVQANVATWVAVSKSTAIDGQRVTGEGFAGALQQATATSTGGTGLDFVLQLGSATAARSEQAAELAEDVIEQGHVHVTHFTVPGIPGSEGIAAAAGKRGSAANVLFTEGRCVLLVGNGEVGSRYKAHVIAGALALYRRTISSGGVCTPTGPAQV